MLDRQTILTLFEDTISVFLLNLDFFPDDQLDWKPAPDAKSVLDIVNHLAPFLDSVSAALGAAPTTFVPATNRDESKEILAASAKCYADAVRGAAPAALNEKFRDEFPFTLGWMVTASTIDAIHHAGQIAYIQTLLGDNEIHFNESALPDWAVS